MGCTVWHIDLPVTGARLANDVHIGRVCLWGTLGRVAVESRAGPAALIMNQPTLMCQGCNTFCTLDGNCCSLTALESIDPQIERQPYGSTITIVKRQLPVHLVQCPGVLLDLGLCRL